MLAFTAVPILLSNVRVYGEAISFNKRNRGITVGDIGPRRTATFPSIRRRFSRGECTRYAVNASGTLRYLSDRMPSGRRRRRSTKQQISLKRTDAIRTLRSAVVGHSLSNAVRDRYAEYVSTLTRPRSPPTFEIEDDRIEDDQSTATGGSAPDDENSLAVTKACVPRSTWSRLTGKEFDLYETIDRLVRTGLELCDPSMIYTSSSSSSSSQRRSRASPSPSLLKWRPDKKTAAILKEHGAHGDATLSRALRDVLPPDTVLLWTAKFDASDDAHGAELPVIRTRGIVEGMSPRDIASLLMDSSRVKEYNSISLGRTDVRTLQTGIDTVDGEFGDGESKIVSNLTKPPLLKRLMEFRTMMHARRLRPHEQSDEGEDEEGQGYVTVSRAVAYGEQDDAEKDDGKGNLRSEILLGVNLLRPVPGNPSATDMTCVTHVNSPVVHPMVAGKVGVKGAVDFFNCVRGMGTKGKD